MWMMVLGICERLSAKSCRSCDEWSWVSVNVFPLSHVDHVDEWSWVSVNVFPLSHVDHVAMMVLGICERLSAKSCRSCG